MDGTLIFMKFSSQTPDFYRKIKPRKASEYNAWFIVKITFHISAKRIVK